MKKYKKTNRSRLPPTIFYYQGSVPNIKQLFFSIMGDFPPSLSPKFIINADASIALSLAESDQQLEFNLFTRKHSYVLIKLLKRGPKKWDVYFDLVKCGSRTNLWNSPFYDKDKLLADLNL